MIKAIPRLVAAGVLISACSSSSESVTTTTVPDATVVDDQDCVAFAVYSQNRFQPYGAAIRKEPDVLSDKVGSFAPNEVIAVDGWYDSGEPIYPTNSKPWDSGVWLRLSYDNQEGWVSFPGVRAVPSSPAEPDDSYGGEPVELLPECEIQL